MALEKQGAIKAWRTLAGPTNSEKARETAPNSIRARFGTDGSQNAVHGSDSPIAALREITVVFGVERTLTLIKPDVYPLRRDAIIDRIRHEGFTVVRESEVHFDKLKAEEFYREHVGKAFYEDLTTWMSSAPIYAAVLEAPLAIRAWRNLAGPTNSNKARETKPRSIRALFGTDGSQNAVHGSDSRAASEREIAVVFGMTAAPPSENAGEQAARAGSSPNKARRTNNGTPGSKSGAATPGPHSGAATPKKYPTKSTQDLLDNEAARKAATKSTQQLVVEGAAAAGLDAKPTENHGSMSGSKPGSKTASRSGSKANLAKANSKTGSRTMSLQSLKKLAAAEGTNSEIVGSAARLGVKPSSKPSSRPESVSDEAATPS